MTTEKVQFTKEKETLLMTLNGRAVQSQWKNPILHDPWAVNAVRQIDYDFSKLDKMWGVFSPMIVDIGCTVIATRASTFDMLTRDYLAAHPDAVVLHVGCGMDSRVFRVNPPATVQWFDVDYPDVVEVRKRLFPDRPAYHQIGLPLEDLRWLDEVPGDRPVLFIAEGVLPYVSEAEVKALLNAITHHFPTGQLVFDALHPQVVKSNGSNVAGTGATYKWGLNEPADIQHLEPKLELIKEFRPSELVAFSRFPLAVRAMYRAMELSTLLRRMHRILVYRFYSSLPLDSYTM